MGNIRFRARDSWVPLKSSNSKSSNEVVLEPARYTNCIEARTLNILYWRFWLDRHHLRECIPNHDVFRYASKKRKRVSPLYENTSLDALLTLFSRLGTPHVLRSPSIAGVQTLCLILQGGICTITTSPLRHTWTKQYVTRTLILPVIVLIDRHRDLPLVS